MDGNRLERPKPDAIIRAWTLMHALADVELRYHFDLRIGRSSTMRSDIETESISRYGRKRNVDSRRCAGSGKDIYLPRVTHIDRSTKRRFVFIVCIMNRYMGLYPQVR